MGFTGYLYQFARCASARGQTLSRLKPKNFIDLYGAFRARGWGPCQGGAPRRIPAALFL